MVNICSIKMKLELRHQIVALKKRAEEIQKHATASFQHTKVAEIRLAVDKQRVSIDVSSMSITDSNLWERFS